MGSLSTQSSLNDTERPAAPHRTSRVSRYVTPVSLISMLPLTTLSFECLYVRMLHFGLMHDRWIERGEFVKVCGMFVFVISSSSSYVFFVKDTVWRECWLLYPWFAFYFQSIVCDLIFTFVLNLFLDISIVFISCTLISWDTNTRSYSYIIFDTQCSFVNLNYLWFLICVSHHFPSQPEHNLLYCTYFYFFRCIIAYWNV